VGVLALGQPVSGAGAWLPVPCPCVTGVTGSWWVGGGPGVPVAGGGELVTGRRRTGSDGEPVHR